MKAILTRLFNHEELTSEETKQILLNITKEMYPEAQIAALLTAFQMRSITVDELIGFREALMETRLPIDFAPYRPIDIVGTGGDGKNTFNISTCACFVVAGQARQLRSHFRERSQQCHRAARRTLHQQPRHAETQHGGVQHRLPSCPAFQSGDEVCRSRTQDVGSAHLVQSARPVGESMLPGISAARCGRPLADAPIHQRIL